MIPAAEEFSKAMAAAVVADFEAAPSFLEHIRAGHLDRHGLESIMYRDLTREAKGNPGPVFFPNVRKLIRAQVNLEAAEQSWGLGQWAEIFQGIGAVTTAVVNYNLGKLQISTQERLQESAEARIAEQQRQLDAQAQIERLAYEQAAQRQQAAAAGGGEGGLPSWVVPAGVGVGAAALVALFLLSKKGK